MGFSPLLLQHLRQEGRISEINSTAVLLCVIPVPLLLHNFFASILFGKCCFVS